MACAPTEGAPARCKADSSSRINNIQNLPLAVDWTNFLLL
jgi:hypothetical protein